MNDEDLKLLRGFAHRLMDNGTTNEQTDNCECRVALATEKLYSLYFGNNYLKSSPNSKSEVSFKICMLSAFQNCAWKLIGMMIERLSGLHVG